MNINYFDLSLSFALSEYIWFVLPFICIHENALAPTQIAIGALQIGLQLRIHFCQNYMGTQIGLAISIATNMIALKSRTMDCNAIEINEPVNF